MNVYFNLHQIALNLHEQVHSLKLITYCTSLSICLHLTMPSTSEALCQVHRIQIWVM